MNKIPSLLKLPKTEFDELTPLNVSKKSIADIANAVAKNLNLRAE